MTQVFPTVILSLEHQIHAALEYFGEEGTNSNSKFLQSFPVSYIWHHNDNGKSLQNCSHPGVNACISIYND